MSFGKTVTQNQNTNVRRHTNVMNDKSESRGVALETVKAGYNNLLPLEAGLGGLLYGVDVGIIAGAIEGPITAMNPASALQLHPATIVCLDEAAAAELKMKDYNLRVYDNKPDWQKI